MENLKEKRGRVGECEKDGLCEKVQLCEKDKFREKVELCEKDKFREKIECLHLQFSEYGRNAKEWARKCMLLLPEIDRYKVWAKKGFSSIYEYAAKVAGLSNGQVMEGLRVLKKIENMPALKEVIEKKGINAVRPVATIVTAETAEFWAEKARNMSVCELVTYVRDFRRQGGVGVVGDLGKVNGDSGVASSVTTSFDDFDKQANGSESRNVTTSMELEPEVLDQLEKIKGDGDWNDLMKKFLELREKELEREKPGPVQTESRHIPAEIERYVVERDSGTCVFPGCHRRYKELHHADGFALRRVHDPDRIFCLCEEHHGLAHRGLIENEGMPARFWRARKEVDKSGARFGLDQKVLEHRMASAG